MLKTTVSRSFEINLAPVREIGLKDDHRSLFEKLPEMEFSADRYTVRFARTQEELDAALRLRFEIFNLELNEGLESSYITGRDEDHFDAVCHHLIVLEKETGNVVGTYRLQTLEMAQTVSGFYSSGEFKLEDLPPRMLTESLEIGRACIAREHRNTRVLFLLWKGLANYAAIAGKRYLFGCCSLTSQDSDEGWKASEFINRNDFSHPQILIAPRDKYLCEPPTINGKNDDEDKNRQLPKLFQTYMRFGAKVCSPPALDREFKTIDFFVMIDLGTIDEKARRMFLT